MKGVIGKFFFQFGVTLSVAVMLSYFEAITLAPARCAQMLEHVARGTRARSAASSTAAFARARARLRRASSAARSRHPVKVLVGALVVLAACGYARHAHQDRVHPVAGSEPPQRAHLDRGGHDAARRPRRCSRRPRRASRAHPEIARMLVDALGLVRADLAHARPARASAS